MVLIKKILLPLLILVISSSYAQMLDIKTIDGKLKIKDISVSKLNEEEDYSEEVQILFYQRIQAFLSAIEKGEIKFNHQNIRLNRSIFNLSENFDLEDYDFYDLNDSFDTLLEDWLKKKYKLSIFFNVDFITWNYTLNYKGNSGIEADLLSNEKGWCFGGGVKYENFRWGVESNFCYVYMNATVGDESDEIAYKQGKVPVDAFMFSNGIFWKPASEVAVKFNIPLIYHKGRYNSPLDGSLIDDNKFSVGFLLGGEWRYEWFFTRFNFGKILNYPGSTWSFGIGGAF